MIVIGITGPTGAGKTTALNQLEALGGCVLDADAVYHQLLEEDGDLRRALESRFGPLTGADGSFDRKKLGGVVFHDRAAMDDLNAIVTPYIDRALKTRLAAAEQEGRPAAAIDAIRLVENGLAGLCDATLAVTAPAGHPGGVCQGPGGRPAERRVLSVRLRVYFSQRLRHGGGIRKKCPDPAGAHLTGTQGPVTARSQNKTGKGGVLLWTRTRR